MRRIALLALLLVPVLATPARADYEPPNPSRAQLCAAVTHELGHLSGLSHTTDGLMAPHLETSGVPWDCRVWARHTAVQTRRAAVALSMVVGARFWMHRGVTVPCHPRIVFVTAADLAAEPDGVLAAARADRDTCSLLLDGDLFERLLWGT